MTGDPTGGWCAPSEVHDCTLPPRVPTVDLPSVAAQRGFRPAKPGDTPGAVEPDDAQPQPQVLDDPTVTAVAATLRQLASWGEARPATDDEWYALAEAITNAATGYRHRLRLNDQTPLIAVVPPTLTPATRAWIARRIAPHGIQLETVMPLRGDGTGPGGTVHFLIYQAGTFKIEPTRPLPLGAEDVSRDGEGT